MVLTNSQREALKLLANARDGCTVPFMLSHGCAVEALRRSMRCRLVITDRVRVPGGRGAPAIARRGPERRVRFRRTKRRFARKQQRAAKESKRTCASHVYYLTETNAPEVYCVQEMLGYVRSCCGASVRPQRNWTGDGRAGRAACRITERPRHCAPDWRPSSSALWRTTDDSPQRRGGSSELLLEHR
jgi:hypothetical protein